MSDNQCFSSISRAPDETTGSRAERGTTRFAGTPRSRTRIHASDSANALVPKACPLGYTG